MAVIASRARIRASPMSAIATRIHIMYGTKRAFRKSLSIQGWKGECFSRLETWCRNWKFPTLGWWGMEKGWKSRFPAFAWVILQSWMAGIVTCKPQFVGGGLAPKAIQSCRSSFVKLNWWLAYYGGWWGNLHLLERCIKNEFYLRS